MLVTIKEEFLTAPARRQAQSAPMVAAAQKIGRFREMEAFFRSLPNGRTGMGPVSDNIREMAYEDLEAAPK